MRCDANITVRAATTTCSFAENVFYSFFMDAEMFEPTSAIRAYSPASRRQYRLRCNTTASERVRCVASDGGEVRFDLAALLDYDDAQATRYARTHDLGPGTGQEASQKTDSGSSQEDSSPNLDLSSGNEIPNYDQGRGYRVRCADGMYSKSGGIQGTCSQHGGLADGPSPSSSAPSYDPPSPSGGTVHVDGYFRKDGTYVRPYTRRAPCSYCPPR